MRWSDLSLAVFAQLALSRYAVVVFAASAGAGTPTDQDGSCSANSKNCRPAGAAATASTAPASPGKTAAKIADEPHTDLITQEMDQLQGYIKNCKERIDLLNTLQQTVTSGHDVALPDTHVKALQAEVPPFVDFIIDEDKVPSSAADDYVISKRVMPQVERVAHIKFLPLRNPRTTSSSSTTQTSLPSALLVAVQENGETSLYSPGGELVQAFSVGHEMPVQHLAVSPSHDEYFIVTADTGGSIRVHTIKLRQQRLTKDQKQSRRASLDEKQSQFLGPQVNVTTTFQKQMQMPAASSGDVPRLTAIVAASQRGSKYFVVGDAEGSISVFSRNGTFHAKIDTTAGPGGILGLHSQTSSLVYRTGDEWGFVNLEKMEVNPVECPNFEGRPASVIIDSQQATRVFLTAEDGAVWVLNLKNKKECKVDFVFAKGVIQNGVDLASVRGYILGLEGDAKGTPMSVVCLNMSVVGRTPNPRNPFPASHVVWRKPVGAVREWSVYKRHQQGDLIATLSHDGSSIEIMELLMSTYTPPSTTDTFGNFKLPVIAVAIVLVLGYQYMKQKNKFGGNSSKKYDFDSPDFASLMKNKKLGGGLGKGRLGGLGGSKGLGGAKSSLGKAGLGGSGKKD